MTNDDAKKVLTSLIQKQMVILGPSVALDRARKIEGLELDDKGTVTAINGDADTTLQAVVNEYVSLTGAITQNIVQTLIGN